MSNARNVRRFELESVGIGSEGLAVTIANSGSMGRMAAAQSGCVANAEAARCALSW